jgi:Cellulase (glycosyl hydrolase family 5)
MANFTVTASGGFVAPNGISWTMRGLNAGVQDALQGFGNVLKDYPGLTAIRLNCDSGNDSAASIAQVVQEYTAAGIVVEVEDHSGNGDNVAWYQQMATMFKGNPLVFLETPNEPSADAATTAQNQIGIINAIRAAGFANPIGLQPVGGYDQSNIPTVTAAVGTAGLFATPHIYYGVNDPNGAGQYVQSEIQGALQKGLFPSIDEFGNALDGFTADPQGMTVISSVLAANEGRRGLLGNGQRQPPRRRRLCLPEPCRHPADAGRR